MAIDGKNVKKPLFYFLLVLVFLIALVGWTSYQFGQQSIKNGKNDVQFVDQDGRINKNAQAISELTKQVQVLSTITPKDGRDGKDGKDGVNGKDSVSHDTVVEKQTIQEVPVKGDSAYQTWLSIGNSGDEKDFINSLKGEDARGIEGCLSDGILGWRYVGDITCKVNISSINMKAK